MDCSCSTARRAVLHLTRCLIFRFLRTRVFGLLLVFRIHIASELRFFDCLIEAWLLILLDDEWNDLLGCGSQFGVERGEQIFYLPKENIANYRMTKLWEILLPGKRGGENNRWVALLSRALCLLRLCTRVIPGRDRTTPRSRLSYSLLRKKECRCVCILIIAIHSYVCLVCNDMVHLIFSCVRRLALFLLLFTWRIYFNLTGCFVMAIPPNHFPVSYFSRLCILLYIHKRLSSS